MEDSIHNVPDVPVNSVFAAQAAPEGSANMDAQLLDKLVELWTSHRAQGLKVRLETGSLLNDHLGDPAVTRQCRGQSVMKQAATMLHISVPELYRIRWFSYFDKTDKSFWGDVPDVNRTWTKFKELLPGLKLALNGNEKQQPSSERRNTAMTVGLFKSMESMTAKLRTVNLTADETQKAKLVQKMQELVSAFADATGIRFHENVIEKIVG